MPAILAGKRAPSLHAIEMGIASALVAIVAVAVADAHQVFQTGFFVRKLRKKLAKGWGFLAHAYCMAYSFTWRKGIIPLFPVNRIYSPG